MANADLDAGSREPPLARRLMTARGWTEAFAEGAITEYRKFIYLSAISPEPIIPSAEVDAVWRAHLATGAHTWKDILPVMPGPVLPDPPNMPPRTLHRAFFGYIKTLDYYHQAFGAMAPLEYWPRATDRFPAPTRPPSASRERR